MNWIDLLTPAITTGTVFLVMHLLQRGTATPVAPAANGTRTLRLPKFYAILGYICGGILVLAIGGAIYDGDPTIWWAVLVIFLLSAGLGGACLLWYHHHQVTFNRDRFTVTNWKGKSVDMTWDELTDVSFSSMSGYIHLRGRNNRTKLNHHLVGLQSFLATLEERTEWRVRDLRLPS